MIEIFTYVGGVFIPHPYLALIPAAFFGLMYYLTTSKVVLATAVFWVLYAIYEELHLLRIVCSGECNIRIDLLLVYPVFIIVFLIALFVGIRSMVKSNS